jgi:hypothetical protein
MKNITVVNFKGNRFSGSWNGKAVETLQKTKRKQLTPHWRN